MKSSYIRQFKFSVVVVLTFLLFHNPIYSQASYNVYTTLVGDIYVSGTWNDSSFRAVSNRCVVQLEYETGEFKVELDILTLSSGIDSLDNLLQNSKYHNIKYYGKLGIDVIRTSSHESEEFDVEGYLNCAPHYDRISGSGTTEYIHGDVFSCLLNLSFEINLSDLFGEKELGDFGNEVNVEILQAILKRSNE